MAGRRGECTSKAAIFCLLQIAYQPAPTASQRQAARASWRCTQQVEAGPSLPVWPHRQLHKLAGRAIISKVGHGPPRIQQQQQLKGGQSGSSVLRGEQKR